MTQKTGSGRVMTAARDKETTLGGKITLLLQSVTENLALFHAEERLLFPQTSYSSLCIKLLLFTTHLLLPLYY
jgi:hypothetical protein